MYQYKASIVRIVDGDTVIADVNLGFRTTSRQIFRLLGINTPEMKGITKVSGIASKVHLESLMPQGQEFIAETFKNPQDKYGRYLVNITVSGVNINIKMINDGFAEVMVIS